LIAALSHTLFFAPPLAFRNKLIYSIAEEEDCCAAQQPRLRRHGLRVGVCHGRGRHPCGALQMVLGARQGNYFTQSINQSINQSIINSASVIDQLIVN
jgi:hypothetical protein